MASLCTSFANMRVAPKALASRCNGIAAAPKVAAPRCIALRATATPLVVVAVGQKGGKLKTRKSAAKRYKVTGSGKVMARRPGKQHLNEKMSKSNKKKLSKENPLFVGDVRTNVRSVLPYAKISLAKCREAGRTKE